MIKIKLSPVRMEGKPPALEARGYVLVLDGEPFDFSLIPDGHRLPAAAISSSWFTGEVYRSGSTLYVTLLLPHGLAPSEAVAFPRDIEVVADGEVLLPQDAEILPPVQPPLPDAGEAADE